MKRFYKDVLVVGTSSGFVIHLDDMPVKTPMKTLLQLPTQALADLVAKEWQAVAETIDLNAMLYTKMVATVVDHISNDRPRYETEMLEYLRTDTVCYLDGGNATLLEKQKAQLLPLLQAFNELAGANLQPVMDLSVPEIEEDKTRALIEPLSDFHLMGLHFGAGLIKSFILSYGLMTDILTAEQAYTLSHIEEHLNTEQWGADEEETTRLQGVQDQLTALGNYYAALSG